jgi:hypothetical protein
VVVGYVYQRVILIPRREVLVDVGPDRTEGAVDEVDDTRNFGFAGCAARRDCVLVVAFEDQFKISGRTRNLRLLRSSIFTPM